jgi:D-sedoheptulose 7-phosphate isomerase
VSIITAYANDFSFDGVFARQVESLGQKGDILIAITTSGSSKNCLIAVEQAKKQGLKTLALTKSGGEIANKVDISIQVPSNDTQHIQECHVISYHIIAGLVEELMSLGGSN